MRWAAAAAYSCLGACASVSPPAAPHGSAPHAPAPRVSVETPAKPLQCAPYARERSGVRIFGDAGAWWVGADGRYARGAHPEKGAVLVLDGYRDPARGHVAVVSAVASAREIRVDHANWLNRGEVTRSVPVRDASANGDWSRVNVWHAPGGHWGSRAYRVRGFIYPRPPQAGAAMSP